MGLRPGESNGQAGLTLVEVLVALSLLLAGLAAFFWQMRQHSLRQTALTHKQLALEAARSDLESLQGLTPDLIRDTAYHVPVTGAYRLRLRRVVMDSLDFYSSWETLTLDGHMRPLALREPREVQVSVYEDSGVSQADERLESHFQNLQSLYGLRGLWGKKVDDEAIPLVRLTIRLPEYLW